MLRSSKPPLSAPREDNAKPKIETATDIPRMIVQRMMSLPAEHRDAMHAFEAEYHGSRCEWI
jgi:hypothetical protein